MVSYSSLAHGSEDIAGSLQLTVPFTSRHHGMIIIIMVALGARCLKGYSVMQIQPGSITDEEHSCSKRLSVEISG